MEGHHAVSDFVSICWILRIESQTYIFFSLEDFSLIQTGIQVIE